MTRQLWSYTWILFFTTLMLGISISISASNWLSMWMGMELNIYSFIPLMMTSNLFKEKEGAMKYLFAQAVPSSLILALAITNNYTTTIFPLFITLALAMKLGMAPTHFWFPSVMNSLSWTMCLMLATVQKITPFIIMFNLSQVDKSTMLMIIFLSAFIGGVGGMNQTQLRAILAYSSIGHMAWITATSLLSYNYAIFYFLIYMLTTSSIFLLNIPTNSQTVKQTYNLTQSSIQNWILMLLLMNLGGLPPLMGFFPKLTTINLLIMNNFLFTAMILILGSMMNLFYYLKMIFSYMMVSPSILHFKKLNSFFLSYTLSLTTFMTLFSFIPMMFILTT